MNRALLLLAAVLAQATVLHGLSLRHAPLGIDVVVLLLCLRGDVATTALYGCFAGLLEDALAGTGVVFAFSTTASVLTARLIADRLDVETPAVLVALAVGMATLRGLLATPLLALVSPDAPLLAYRFHQALWEGVAAGASACVCLPLVLAALRRRAR